MSDQDEAARESAPAESPPDTDSDTDDGDGDGEIGTGDGDVGADDGEEPTIEELLSALEAVSVQRDQHLDDLQRVSAEFANFRRQTEKRNVAMAAQAGSRLAEALLPVLDACDAAAQQGVEGVEPIASQLWTVLERGGLEMIDDQSEGFDPKRHEAAISEPGDPDQSAPIVAEVLRTGYAWNGRVLRAAMVKVKG